MQRFIRWTVWYSRFQFGNSVHMYFRYRYLPMYRFSVLDDIQTIDIWRQIQLKNGRYVKVKILKCAVNGGNL